MAKCWFCGNELIWQSDFSFEDYGLEGEWIVAVLVCSGCGSTFEGYNRLDEEEEE